MASLVFCPRLNNQPLELIFFINVNICLRRTTLRTLLCFKIYNYVRRISSLNTIEGLICATAFNFTFLSL